MSNYKTHPPRWANRLLHLYCAPHLLEEIEGDLQEEFECRLKQDGRRKASWDYIHSVLGFIKPFAIKRKVSSNSFSMNMYKHYLTVALRNLVRHKSFAAINIIGLALGMTCCLFIFLWVKDEKSIDNFHVNGKTLYSVYQTFSTSDQVNGTYDTPLTLGTTEGSEGLLFLADEMKRTIPEIKYAVSYATGYELPWGHPETFQVGEKIIKLEGSRASEDFFKMFSYPLVAGDSSTALKGVSSIAISKQMASFFFTNSDDALGKSIRFENSQDFLVSAVFEDVTPQCSLNPCPTGTRAATS